MAGLTLAQAEARLALYLDAEEKVLLKQSYRIGERMLTMADLGEIRKGIETWNSRVQQLSDSASGRSRARTIVPAG